MTGDAVRDFPSSKGVPSNLPVYGIDSGGVTSQLATSWADFMDGTKPLFPFAPRHALVRRCKKPQ
jgi:hypothetical protein